MPPPRCVQLVFLVAKIIARLEADEIQSLLAAGLCLRGAFLKGTMYIPITTISFSTAAIVAWWRSAGKSLAEIIVKKATTLVAPR